MNYVYGKSQQQLKAINSLACSNNLYYVTARNTYNAIMSEAEEFIKSNAPVKELIICRTNFNYEHGVLYSKDDMSYCLSIRYIPKSKDSFAEATRTLYAFKMSSELVYILRSEGWKYCPYNPGVYYYLDISDDK